MGWRELAGLDPVGVGVAGLGSVDAGERPRPAFAVPDHPLVRAIAGALMASGPNAADCGWRSAGGGLVIVQRPGLDWVQVRLEAGSDLDAARAMAQLSPLCLDAIVPLLADDPGQGRGRSRIIRASAILEAKGCRRWGDERRALERQVGRELQVLRRLSCGAAGPLLFDLTPIGDSGCEFIYQPGAWLLALRAASPVRFVDAAILHLDHRANRGADVLAKKLALHLALSSAARACSVRTVRSLLAAVGCARSDLDPARARRGRLADRFEEAVLRLAEHRLFEIRPRNGCDGDWVSARAKGWVDQWLNRQVLIRPMAEDVPDRAVDVPWNDKVRVTRDLPSPLISPSLG